VLKTHAGVVVIPTALAVAEACRASGRDFITAIVAGYEVMLRIAMGLGPVSHRLRGWRSTSTTGTFGAATAAGKLLRLNLPELASALGLAGDQSAGLYAWEENGSRSFVLGTLRALQDKGFRVF